MSIETTSQLIQALALHFFHNKNFNLSILETLCQEQKIHSSTTSQQISKKIQIIDKGFQLILQNRKIKDGKRHNKTFIQSTYEKEFFNMINVFIFNVSATNQHYFNQIEKQMTQSTASQSNNLQQTFYKDKIAIDTLKQRLRLYYEIVMTSSNFLQNIIVEIQNSSSTKISESQINLLETLDYLCVKYSISNKMSERIIRILQKNDQNNSQNMSKLFNTDSIRQINRLIFTQARQNEFYQILELSSSVNFKNLINIIDANYLHKHPPRKIFSAADISGKQVIQNILIKIFKRIGKNELFSQKTEEYVPFRFFIYHLMNKHFSIYYQFNKIIKDMMYLKNLNNSQSLKKLNQIQQFFRIFISIQNPVFQSLLKFIFNQLSKKYSEHISLELIKKLLLNRYLLNPSFFVLYNEPNQKQIKDYVQIANIIRTFFYPNKAQELGQKLKNAEIKKISQEINQSLQYCIKTDKSSQIQIKTFLYVNDKILKNQIQTFYQELKPSHHNIQERGAIQNMASDYSLSFSVVKNEQQKNTISSRPLIENISEVKLPQTNRSNNIKENYSVRYVYDQLKDLKSHNQLPVSPPRGQKYSSKQYEMQQQEKNGHKNLFSQSAQKQQNQSHATRLYTMNLPTDRQMIQELVQMRKDFGQRKRVLKLQSQDRKVRRQKKIAYIKGFSTKFNHYKMEIQRENNVFYIHMTATL